MNDMDERIDIGQGYFLEIGLNAENAVEVSFYPWDAAQKKGSVANVAKLFSATQSLLESRGITKFEVHSLYGVEHRWTSILLKKLDQWSRLCRVEITASATGWCAEIDTKKEPGMWLDVDEVDGPVAWLPQFITRTATPL